MSRNRSPAAVTVIIGSSIGLPIALSIVSSMLVLSITAREAQAQLPPAPTPVPGSLLDRPRPGTSPQQGAAPHAEQAPARAARQVALGTAFRISEAGHLVTNRHVVEGCRAIGIVVGNRATANLRLLATDPDHDLALLARPPSKQAAMLRADDDPIQGEDALTYGFPLMGMLSASGQLGAGMITALTGIRNHAGQLQTDVPLQRGNSGGPLLDRRGQVIGVVFAKLDALRVAQLTGDLPQNVNFAVRLAPLKRLLDANGVRYRIGDPAAPSR
jgi:S1-C subfamily serine protease